MFAPLEPQKESAILHELIGKRLIEAREIGVGRSAIFAPVRRHETKRVGREPPALDIEARSDRAHQLIFARGHKTSADHFQICGGIEAMPPKARARKAVC